jgi:hypothetical protein
VARTKLEWYPSGGGSSILFTTGPDAVYRLLSADGIGPIGIEAQSIKSPGETGETAVDVIVPPRVVTIQALIQAPDADTLWTRRAALARAVVKQPTRLGEEIALGQLRLTLDGRPPLYLDAMVRSASLPRAAGQHVLAAADLEFLAPYPYWKELSDSLLYFTTDAGGFEWPVEMGFEMTSNNVQQEVDNLGDVDAPPLFRIYGEATTVRMINDTTGETIEVTGSLAANEYLEIQTRFGAKSITLVGPGGSSSAMDRLNLDAADFWTLRPGLNIVRFEADVNVSGHAEMLWRQRYSGV